VKLKSGGVKVKERVLKKYLELVDKEKNCKTLKESFSLLNKIRLYKRLLGKIK